MSEQQSNVEQRVDFDKKFSEERSEWTEKIRVLSVRMKNIRELGEVQVELFSSRQILLEYSAKLGQVMTKLNAKHRKDRGERLRHYSENSQVKYGANEKTPLIEGDLSELKERIDIVENQISFINETIKTVDHCLYGIKSRIALEDYLRSGAVKNNY
jgi:predicted HTH domain antitoxin